MNKLNARFAKRHLLSIAFAALAVIAVACNSDATATQVPSTTATVSAPASTTTPEPTANSVIGSIPKATSASELSTSRTIQHTLGETTIEGSPERVVVLEFSFVDALASVGISPVGIADDNKRGRIIPRVAEIIGDDWVSVGTRAQPNLEVILSLEPDLIIADFQRHSAIYDELSELAPTIVLKSLQASYAETLDSMVTIGQALGKVELVNARIEEHSKSMTALAEQVPNDENRTFLAAVVWDEGFNAHASEAYTMGVLKVLGLESAIVQEDPYAELNLESLVAIDPDVMFLMVAGDHTLVDDWESNPLWQNLIAVQNESVINMDRNLWSRFRGIIAAEEIAKDTIAALYP